MAWSSPQQLNNNGTTDGATNAPPAAGDPFVSMFDNQMHVAYLANDGAIWDVWCVPFPNPPGQWNPERRDVDPNPGKNPIGAGPSVGVYQNQQHFCYMRTGYPVTTEV